MNKTLITWLLVQSFFNQVIANPVFSFDPMNGNLMNQCSRRAPKYDYQFKPTEEEISAAEHTLHEISRLKTKLCGKPYLVKSPHKFVRQYIGYSYKSNKFLYLNALITDSPTNKAPMIVCDCGPSNWGVTFDLKNKSFNDLIVSEGKGLCE